MEVNGYRQLFDYRHSSKYLLLCSAEEEEKKIINFWVNYPFNMNHDWSLEEKKL